MATTRKAPFPDLPLVLHPLPGYQRLYAPSVKFKAVKQRFLFHELDACSEELQALLSDSNSSVASSRLQEQLAQWVSELQDADVDDSGNQLRRRRQRQEQEQQAQQLSWLSNVRLVDVQAEGPGSRVYNPAQQLQTVVSAREFAAHEFVGLYLGYVLDDSKYDSDVPAADRQFYRYQYNFSVSASRGEGQARTGGRQDAAFLVDASCCLEGNPLAHLLDYRAFKQGWEEDAARSVAGGPNAMLLPFSDNSTGRVYVAVLTLRAAAAGEELCIDYGAEYWGVKRDHEDELQLARQQVRGEMLRSHKQQLKQAADKQAALLRTVATLRHELQQLVHASSAAVLTLSSQPGCEAQFRGLAAANACATMVLAGVGDAVAAADEVGTAAEAAGADSAAAPAPAPPALMPSPAAAPLAAPPAGGGAGPAAAAAPPATAATGTAAAAEDGTAPAAAAAPPANATTGLTAAADGGTAPAAAVAPPAAAVAGSAAAADGGTAPAAAAAPPATNKAPGSAATGAAPQPARLSLGLEATAEDAKTTAAGPRAQHTLLTERVQLAVQGSRLPLRLPARLLDQGTTPPLPEMGLSLNAS